MRLKTWKYIYTGEIIVITGAGQVNSWWLSEMEVGGLSTLIFD